jgi:TetR/AcrR family transcriptional repressor of nem operon
VSTRKAATREETKQQTRGALIDAGIALFASQGLDVSLDAICDEAGFTRGAFYVHFADRDAFLEVVMDRLGTQFLDAVLGVAGDEDAGLAGTATRFFRAVAMNEYPLMREGGVRPHQLLDACARSPAIRRRYVALAEESVARLTKIVRADQRAGKVRDDMDAPSIATILLAAIIGVQTMNDLKMPVDLARTGLATLRLLAPKKRA